MINKNAGAIILILCIGFGVGIFFSRYVLPKGQETKSIVVKEEIARLDTAITEIQKRFNVVSALKEKSQSDSNQLGVLQTQFYYYAGIRDYLKQLHDPKITINVPNQ